MAILTLRGSSVADATLTNAGDMSLNTTGGTEVGKQTIITGLSKTYAEITSLGGTVADVLSIPATPTGKGWVYQPGAGTFANATWQAKLTLAFVIRGAPNTLTFRIFQYSSGAYTLIGSLTATVTTLAKTTYTTNAGAMPATTFASTDLLYFDLWWHDASGDPSGDNPTIYESTSATTGVLSDVEVTTADFASGLALSAESDGVGTLSGTITTPGQVALIAEADGQGGLIGNITPPPPTYAVQIGGTKQFVIEGTLQGGNAIGQRSTASFHVLTDTSTHFGQYQQVAIYDQNQLLAFSGYVDQPNDEYQPGFQPQLVHEITCIDQHYLADKRIIATVYYSQTCGFIVQDIVTTILAAEGVTVGMIATGATVPVANFGYCTVAAALDALVAYASASGIPYFWMIDQFKQIWFLPYTAIAGTTVDGTTIDAGRASRLIPKVTHANPKYRNKQYAVGGVAQTGANDETRAGDGQTTSFSFKYALAQAPSLFTLNGVTKTLGTKGQTGFQYYWAPGDNTIAQDSSQTVLVSTDRLRMVYIGQYATTFQAQNAAQITAQAALDGTSGINEEVLEDKTITTANDGNAKVNQQLTQYDMPGSQFVFATQDPQYQAGQLITVLYPPYGFGTLAPAYIGRAFGGTLSMADDPQTQSAIEGPGVPMLVGAVAFSDQADGFNIWYTVTAVVGPYDITWVDFFGNLLKKPTFAATTISVGVTLPGALFPSPTLLPAPTLFPS